VRITCTRRQLDECDGSTSARSFAPWQWAKGVVGVVEIPAQNLARADIVLSNFAWNAPQNDAITAYAMGPGGGRQIFNGRAVAVFVHYTNGRWILLRIETPMGNWENLNIAAP
jgi:hypothetical protein